MSKTGLVVQLIGEDGNAFLIIARCCRVLRRAGYSKDDIESFTKDAMSGDYSHVLAVVQEWFEVE